MAKLEGQPQRTIPAFSNGNTVHNDLFDDGGRWRSHRMKKPIEPPSTPLRQYKGKPIVGDREYFEKSMISQRKRGEGGGGDVVIDPITPAEGTASSSTQLTSPEHHGFDTAANELRMEQENKREAQRQRWEDKRQRQIAEEQSHWHLETMLQQTPTATDARIARKPVNRSNAHFDIITFSYADSPEGDALKNKDQRKLERHEQRSKELYRRGNTYNPLTGMDIRPK